MFKCNIAAQIISVAAVLLVGQVPASQELSEFEAYKQQTMTEFETYRTAYLDEFDHQRQALMAVWDQPDQSNANTYISYSQAKTERAKVDFSTDTIEVSIIHDSDSAPQIQRVLEQLQQLADTKLDTDTIGAENGNTPRLLTTLPSSPDALKQIVEEAAITQRPLEYGAEQQQTEQEVIKTQHQQALNAIDKQADFALSNGAEEIAVEASLKREKEKINAHEQRRLQQLKEQYQQQRRHDPSAKTMTTYKIPLPSQSLDKKAARYLPFVTKQSAQWSIPAELVFSIMQAESSFNPKAKSHIPAFGLMQIVPASAGLDVNDKLLNKKGKPSERALFEPDENIRYGTGYLHLLDTRYLVGITNDEARLYCTIAAYNTGAGNVAKAFNTDNSRNIRKASKIINSMTPDQVYQRLQHHLPYEETQTYLKRVRRYHQQYSQLKSNWL
ncbi:membrane-bound lytic murein transglycosylase C [Ferrimonas sediminum]|uniref:Membrane-bound lytic murein transglycosylase C n=1 Tax=Ferrimonas sediminum TaxID=718193 RepID=A0A1G8LW28_9GAMM|nr:transglycosylase SLT domain-containing protein [Ferrimonas sediminum]SDI59962.1 membrane-bound lytic murein transglycosylase C [Ferrimonas sediminum]